MIENSARPRFTEFVRPEISNKVMKIVPALLGLGLIAYNTLFPKSVETCLVHLSYYVILSLVAVAGLILENHLRAQRVSITSFLYSHRLSLLVGILGAMVVFATVPVGYKVLSDEADLISVSRSMLNNQTIKNVYMQWWYIDHFEAIPGGTVIPKRPFLFPFAIHLLHQFTGYRSANAFILNFIFLFLLLAIAHGMVSKARDKIAGVSAVAFMLSVPLLSVCATSAGFELFSLCFAVFCLLALWNYLERPSDSSLLLLWATLLLLIHTRYEAFLYAGVIITVLLITKSLRREDFQSNWELYSGTPFFLLPFFWQRIFYQDLSYRHLPTVANPKTYFIFRPENLWDHAHEILLPLGISRSFIPFLALAAFLLVSISLYWIIQRTSLLRKSRGILALTIAICLLVNLIVFLSHSAGSILRPTASRYFLTALVAISLLPLLLRKIPSRALFVLSIITFLCLHPRAMSFEYWGSLSAIKENRVVTEFLRPYDKKHTLIISKLANQHAVEEFSIIDFNMANLNADKVRTNLQNALLIDVIVVQTINRKTGLPFPNETFTPSLPLTKIHEVGLDDLELIRFSRVDFSQKTSKLR